MNGASNIATIKPTHLHNKTNDEENCRLLTVPPQRHFLGRSSLKKERKRQIQTERKSNLYKDVCSLWGFLHDKKLPFYWLHCIMWQINDLYTTDRVLCSGYKGIKYRNTSPSWGFIKRMLWSLFDGRQMESSTTFSILSHEVDWSSSEE